MTIRSKRLGLMLAAAFTMMPLPALMEAQASSSSPSVSHHVAVPAMLTPVNRAGVAINGVMKAAIDPIRIGDVYYVPFKDFARILDYDDIRYGSSSKTYTATDGSVTVKATIGGSRAMKGDEVVSIRPLEYINGTAYISVDAASTLFNTFTYFKTENGSVQVQMPARKYIVQRGDALWRIAQAHHTTIPAILAVNALKSDILMVGQVLQLPAESQTREMDPVQNTTPAPAPAPSPVRTAPSSPTPVTSTMSSKQQAIVTTAKKYLGVPYKFGAKPSEAPRYFDCSSYIQYVFGQNGITLPRDSRQQSGVGMRATSLQVGDLLFFKYPERYSDGRVGHVGIYIGNGQMIHTVPKTGVVITNYQKSSYWTKNYLYAKRVIQ